MLTTVNEKIVAETKRLTAQYRDAFAGKPDVELAAWFEIALRRESMVREIYGAGQRKRKIEREDGAERVAWDALTEIWQQEARHTTEMAARLQDGIFMAKNKTVPKLISLIGKVEGQVLCALTSERPSLGQKLARFVRAIGSVATPDRVPDFTLELDAMPISEFFKLAQTLELTAKESYRRMTAISEELLERDQRPSIQLEGVLEQIRRVFLDEQFHEQAFGEMTSWIGEDDHFDKSLNETDCAKRICALLPRIATKMGPGGQQLFATDGGLGNLFKRYNIAVEVAA
jgi:hypothetical protein